VSSSIALNIAVVTVSDTRSEATDKSGLVLRESLQAAHAILLTGGTGFTVRDNTFEAIKPLFDVDIEGFGELFRQLSYEEIGTSTIQSRAFAGLANGTIIFCVPGSPGACRTAWDRIIAEQLDSSHKPCNFTDKLRFQ